MEGISRKATLYGSGIFLFAFCATALAQPPETCARKFIGSWDWTSSTGIHTHQVFGSGGYANCSENAACTRSETWTCSGNQFTYNNGMYNTVLTLSADGRTMTGMGGFPPNLQTVVRVGAVAPGSPPPSLPTTPPKPDAYSTEAIAKRLGDSYVKQAQALELDLKTSSRAYAEQEWQQAINRYSSAAEQYEIAGDKAKVAWAKQQEERLRNSTLTTESRKGVQVGKKRYSKQQCDAIRQQLAVLRQNGGDTSQSAALDEACRGQ